MKKLIMTGIITALIGVFVGTGLNNNKGVKHNVKDDSYTFKVSFAGNPTTNWGFVTPNYDQSITYPAKVNGKWTNENMVYRGISDGGDYAVWPDATGLQCIKIHVLADVGGTKQLTLSSGITHDTLQKYVDEVINSQGTIGKFYTTATGHVDSAHIGLYVQFYSGDDQGTKQIGYWY